MELGWLVLSNGVESVNCWRWTVMEHYDLERWWKFIRATFPLAKGYSIGFKLFLFPADDEDWSKRRLEQEWNAVLTSMSTSHSREVTVFVKDNNDIRREKAQKQQIEKAKKQAAKQAAKKGGKGKGKGKQNNQQDKAARAKANRERNQKQGQAAPTGPKICAACKTEKPMSDFSKSQGKKAKGKCIACSEAAQKIAQEKKAAAKKAKEAQKKGGDGKDDNNNNKPKVSKEAKLARKEGGKKGQDLAGLSDMGGVKYFHVALESINGDWKLMEEAMQGANTPVDPNGDDRKGGAGNLGKFFLSAGEKSLIIYGNVPAELEKAVPIAEWTNKICEATGAKVIFGPKNGFVKAELKADLDKEVFPLKARDVAIGTGYAFLRSQGVVPEDDDSSDLDWEEVNDAEGIEW